MADATANQNESPNREWGDLAPHLVAIVALLVAIGWAYWPAMVEMVAAWNRDPDYSHGFLVAPIAVFFLWSRRAHLRRDVVAPSLAGLVVLAGCLMIRAAAGVYFLGPVDSWTIPLSIAGAVMLVGGWPLLRWAAPSIAFLYFMIPIPYSAETWLSVPLQGIATKLSTETLQLLGQPALAEGNVIWLQETPLMVAEACSGLRILVGVFALAFAFVLFSNWSWWQKALVLVAAIPVALLSNTLRIVATALLQRMVSGEVAHAFSHDFAGVVMIPLAAALFWLLLVYLDRLFPRVEAVTPYQMVTQPKD